VHNDSFYKLRLSSSGNSVNTYRSLESSDTSLAEKIVNKYYSIGVRVKYSDGRVLSTLFSEVKK
jgi:hypothetical protein